MDLHRRMLAKEDETGEEIEVRREDQDKINRFSRLHQREMRLQEELQSKQRDKDDLDEISSELELADDDEKIRYKIGDSFLSLPLPEVQDLLANSTAKIEHEVSGVEDQLHTIREEMEQLKIDLYARFGRSINLEN